MAPGDRPDALTPAERAQYEDKYVPRKLRDYETGRRNQAELSWLAIEVNRERLIARGVNPEKARLQAPTLAAPILQDSDRGKDPQALARELT